MPSQILIYVCVCVCMSLWVSKYVCIYLSSIIDSISCEYDCGRCVDLQDNGMPSQTFSWEKAKTTWWDCFESKEK